MKKNGLRLLTFCLLLMSLQGCISSSNHRIRIFNEYCLRVESLWVGGVQFSEIKPGTSSSYKSFKSGFYLLSGQLAKNHILLGSILVQGIGNHEWLLRISSGGEISLVEE